MSPIVATRIRANDNVGPVDGDAGFYVENGYLVAEGVLSKDELAELRTDAARFARGDYPIINPIEVDEGADDEAALRQLLAVHYPHWVSPAIASYITHPGIAAVLHQITGAHLPYWDGAVKCMQTMLFVKAPGLPGQAWHQDERYIATRDRSLVGAWIALDDATRENGCLRVLPGSHRSGYLWPTRKHERPDEFDPSDEAYGFDDAGEVLVEVSAGSVVFFNGYLLHRSLSNRSTDCFRRALVNHYCNAWSLLPWNLPGTPVDSGAVALFDNRRVVPVGDDPYADKGYVDPPGRVFIRPHHDWADVGKRS
jgi:ectoine hydroxylase-related dioxygenase (phytanoyl-CoA dioxygenase family)